ncbi:MAG: M23 family metallopeptidase [Desulfobacteraceae bacterium]|nr:hypothetical protein [Desulfobacteraceae bacterium]MBC2754513.1 M23 family metallopeptidase [Desulfobacteraceae bacterium]
MKHLPQSKFVSYLIRINKLNACDFDRFILFQGMMFGSEKKWWGTKGIRRSLHEGLDLCFFTNTRNEYFRLDETVKVPMLYDGRVEHITEDFLGKTVITSHCFDDPDQPALLSLFGHLNPGKNLKIGDEIKQGQVFAKISGFENKKQILLPHLHISLTKSDLLPPANCLEWEFLNRVDRSVFMDPLKAISPKYSIIEHDDELDVSKVFTRCSQFKAAQN